MSIALQATWPFFTIRVESVLAHIRVSQLGSLPHCVSEASYNEVKVQIAQHCKITALPIIVISDTK
jgi:hypothetical protein